MLVVNLFGAPGAGKSTGAAYIYATLKMFGYNAELVTEFAKDKVWENNTIALSNQPYVYGEQSYRMSRCKDKVDIIVTDSPLLLSIIYNKDDNIRDNFNRMVQSEFDSYNNLNFLLSRDKPYNLSGRLQSETESDSIHNNIVQMLKDLGIEYSNKIGNVSGYDSILIDIMLECRKLQIKNSKIDSLFKILIPQDGLSE